MKKIIIIKLLLIYSVLAFAKTPLTICSTSLGRDFPAGDGSVTNPYVICNQVQFNRISEDSLISQHYKLGSDINFSGKVLKSVGNSSAPFIGGFDGNGYTLTNITLETLPENVGVFSVISGGASLSNITIDTIMSTGGNRRVGGLVGSATGGAISQVVIVNANMKAPDSSGILAGQIQNTTITSCSVQGVLKNSFGADASGGLVGFASNSTISNSKANVDIINFNESIFGISDIGGLVGYASNTQIQDVYVLGRIDYSSAGDRTGPREVGGIVGIMNNNSTLNRAYVVASLNINARRLGAAVGRSYNIDQTRSQGVVWNSDVSVVDESALGSPATSATMGSISFWQALNFNVDTWTLVPGQYPELK